MPLFLLGYTSGQYHYIQNYEPSKLLLDKIVKFWDTNISKKFTRSFSEWELIRTMRVYAENNLRTFTKLPNRTGARARLGKHDKKMIRVSPKNGHIYLKINI